MSEKSKPNPLQLNINIVKVNGGLGIRFYRDIQINEKNKEFIEKVLTSAYNSEKITADIEIKDKIKAFYKLKDSGINLKLELIKN